MGLREGAWARDQRRVQLLSGVRGTLFLACTADLLCCSTCAPSQQPCEPPFKPTLPCNIPDTKRYFVDKVYRVGGFEESRADDIANEIVANGPLEVCFSVYQNFVTYKSGVYMGPDGSALLGGHCVRALGFGVEAGVPYWEIANSWTTTWGNGGRFRILRGQDTVGIESNAVAGTMRLN